MELVLTPTQPLLRIATIRGRRCFGPIRRLRSRAIVTITIRSLPGLPPPTPVASRRLDTRRCKQTPRLLIETLAGVFEIMRVDLGADAVSAASAGCNVRGSRPHERVEHGVADETEHANQSLSQLNRIRRRMI